MDPKLKEGLIAERKQLVVLKQKYKVFLQQIDEMIKDIDKSIERD